MKAKIVSQKVFEGVMDYVHGGGYAIRRLVVEQYDNLAITPHDNQVFAYTGLDLHENCEVIGEVEVPDELIEKAVAFVSAKKEFDALKGVFEGLLKHKA